MPLNIRYHKRMDNQLSEAATLLQSAATNLIASLNDEIQKLNAKEAQLQSRLQDFEARKEHCAAEYGNADASDNDIVEINAGGEIIAARRGVLCQFNSRFEALFSGRWDKKLQRDSKGRIFLDVNPTAFRAIVDWLNEIDISSEEDCPEYPSVDEEHEDILKHHVRLFSGHMSMIQSNIITTAEETDIIHDWLIEDKSDGELHLLYDSTTEGFSPKTFHERCDNKGPTLILIETVEGWVMGGYSNSPWPKELGDHCSASKAFIFNLRGYGLPYPIKRKLKDEDDITAIRCNSEGGPAFGSGDMSLRLRVSGSEVVLCNGQSYEPLAIGQLSAKTPRIHSIQAMEVFQIWRSEIQEKQIASIVRPEKGPDECRFTEEVNDAINARSETLQKLEWEVIVFEECFKDEEQFIDLFASGSVNDVVTLNVSGTKMVLKRETLLAVEESMLAQQFNDTKWTEQGCGNVRVKEWTPEEVSNWTKSLEGMQEDVSNLFIENNINGSELLALNEFGLEKIGVQRVGTICLLLKEIQQLEQGSQDVVTFIEHNPYCFGKLIDFLRLKHLSSIGLTVEPALPLVIEHKKELFEKMIRYYFPGDRSKLILR